MTCGCDNESGPLDPGLLIAFFPLVIAYDIGRLFFPTIL